MKEIEIKILDINPQDIRKKLKALGAQKFFDGEVDVLLFDYPDKRIQKSGATFRLRKAGDRVELCFKDKKERSTFKIAEETEVLTTSFENTRKIIEKLGFIKTSAGKKQRECSRINNIKFDMDTYPNIPTYLEVEAPTAKEVETYVKKLGFTMKQTTNMTAHEVEEYYEKKRKDAVKPEYMQKLKRIEKQSGLRFKTKDALLRHLKDL